MFARLFYFVGFALFSLGAFAADLTVAKVFVDDVLYRYPNIQKYVDLSDGTSEKYMKFLVRADGILPDLSGLVDTLRDAEIPWAESYYYDSDGKQKSDKKYSESDNIFLYSKSDEERCLAHDDSVVSRSGNLCIIFGIGENACKDVASQDGGVFWQHWQANLNRLDSTGMLITEDTCLYILDSVYKRMSAVCTSLGGTPVGENCENINVSSIPSNQTCKEYVSSVYTEWPIYGTSSEMTSGHITKCSFGFLSHIPEKQQTYVAEELRGTCFYPGMGISGGRCQCQEGYGVDYTHTATELNEIGCEPCDSIASDYFYFGCGH